MRRGFDTCIKCLNNSCNTIRYTPFIAKDIRCLCFLIEHDFVRDCALTYLEDEYKIETMFYKEPKYKFKKNQEVTGKDYNFFIEMKWINEKENEPFYVHDADDYIY
jgi:hypothetical protein